jgi:hypothetical protein
LFADIDENQILNFFAETNNPVVKSLNTVFPTLSHEPIDHSLFSNVESNTGIGSNPNFEEVSQLPHLPLDSNFDALDAHLTNLSEDVDLLQDQIYGIGSAVGVDNLNDLNWSSTSNPGNGEALMELIGTEMNNDGTDDVDLKHKIQKDEDFDFDEFFNQ